MTFMTFKQEKWSIKQILTEEKYKNLFENSPNAILLIDFNGSIIDCNSTAIKLFGYDKNYFIGKSLNELHKIFTSDIKPYLRKFSKRFLKEIFQIQSKLK